MCTLHIDVLGASGTTLYLNTETSGVVHLPPVGPQPADLFVLLACSHDEDLTALREAGIDVLARDLARRRSRDSGDGAASIPQLRLNTAKVLNPVLERAGCPYQTNDFLVFDQDRARLAPGIVRTDVDIFYSVCRDVRALLADAGAAPERVETLLAVLENAIGRYEQSLERRAGLFQEVDTAEPRHRWRAPAREALARRYAEMVVARDRLRRLRDGEPPKPLPAPDEPAEAPGAAPQGVRLSVNFAGVPGARPHPVHVWLVWGGNTREDAGFSPRPGCLNFCAESGQTTAAVEGEWHRRDDYRLELDWGEPGTEAPEPSRLLRWVGRLGARGLRQVLPMKYWTPEQPGAYEMALAFDTRTGRFRIATYPVLLAPVSAMSPQDGAAAAVSPAGR